MPPYPHSICWRDAAGLAGSVSHPVYLRNLLDIVRAECSPLGLFTDLTCAVYTRKRPEPTIATAATPAAIANKKGRKPRPSPASGKAGAASSLSESPGGGLGVAGAVSSLSGSSGVVLVAAAVLKRVSADQADQSP